jgi:hypothetical protein
MSKIISRFKSLMVVKGTVAQKNVWPSFFFPGFTLPKYSRTFLEIVMVPAVGYNWDSKKFEYYHFNFILPKIVELDGPSYVHGFQD